MSGFIWMVITILAALGAIVMLSFLSVVILFGLLFLTAWMIGGTKDFIARIKCFQTQNPKAFLISVILWGGLAILLIPVVLGYVH